MASILERTILVRGVPLLDGDDDNASVKDKLEVYFGKRKNGGGEVELIVCPFGGDQKKALVVFELAKVVDTVIGKKQVIEDEEVEVQKLPPIIGCLTASIDKFYWNAIPRDKCKELTKNIDKLVSGGTVAASKFRLKEVSGSADELEDVQACILEYVGLLESGNSASNATPSGIVERCAYIENLPLLSDDKEQLEQEIQTHAKTQARAEIERVICSIQGDMKRALAIFKSSEDRDRFLQHGDHEFFDETIEVKELPPVYDTLRAEVDIFFTKSIAKNKLKDIERSMQAEFGASFSFDGKNLVGTSYQVEEAVARFTEALGLPRKTSGDLKNDDDDHQFPTRVTEKPTSSMMATRMEINTKSSVTKETNKQDSSEVDKGAGGFNKTSLNGKSGSGASRTQQDIPSEDHMDVEEDRNVHMVRTNSLGTRDSSKAEIFHPPHDDDPNQQLAIVDDHFDHPSGASNFPSNGRHKAETSSRGTSSDDMNYGSDGTAPRSIPITSSFIPVDNMLYQYIKVTYKDQLENIEKQYHVKIKFDKHEMEEEGKIVVEIKGKKNNADVEKAKEEFWALKENVERETTRASVSCKAVDGSKHKTMVDKLKKKFPEIIVAWQYETDCYLFGKTAMVQKAEEELNDTINCYESMAVDEIAFEYLTTVRKDELEDLKKKYNIRIELQETASVTNQKMAYIKTNKATWNKKKCKLEDLRDAKESFIDLYQKNFFSLKRVPVKCPGIAKSVLRGAFERTKQKFPHVIMREETDEVIICTEEEIVDDVVREFRSLAGLVSKRKLKKVDSDSSEQLTQRIRQTTSKYHSSDDSAAADGISRGEQASLTQHFLTAEGLGIHVVSGDLTTQKVDVVVNSASSYMKHNGGVAKAISEKAGPGLQKECSDLLKRKHNGHIPIGHCLVSSSYKLPCNHVVHAVGPQFDGNKADFSKDLETTFSVALLKSDSLGAKSIAIPLISSGQLGGSKAVCADVLTDALKIFSEGGSEHLQHVFLVNMDEEATHVLQQICSKKFKPAPSKPHHLTSACATEKVCFKTKRGIEVKIESGDITKIDVDIIVNAANKHLRHGSGVAGAISKAAGKEMQDECSRTMKGRAPLVIGECIVTQGYRLPCRILHIAGPIYGQRSSDKKFYEELKETFLSAIKYTNIPVQAKTLAVPLISSGIYGGPKDICATALLDAIDEFDKESYHVVETIHLINLDDAATQAIVDAFTQRSSGAHRAHLKQPPVARTPDAPEADMGYKTAHGIQLHVEKGDITTLNVDVILNPTDPRLEHRFGVANAIAKAAGSQLRQKCDSIMRQRRYPNINIDNGEVIETPGYRLSSKHILHTPTPVYITGRHREYQDALTQLYQKCLQWANGKPGFTSIAVPIIGAGQAGCPKEVCANALTTAIKLFDEREKHIHLASVWIVSIDEEAVRAIDNAVGKLARGDYKRQNVPQTPRSLTASATSSGASYHKYESTKPEPQANNSATWSGGQQIAAANQGAIRKNTPGHSSSDVTATTSQDAGQQGSYFNTLVTPVMGVVSSITSTVSSAFSTPEPYDTTHTHSSSKSYASVVSDTKQPLCKKCYTSTGLKYLEGCDHTFCRRCITEYVAPTSECLTCKALYCVVSGPLNSTMTYYTRTNMAVPRETSSGAIVIRYNFPDGTLKNGKYRGRHYKGNMFSAYLPNNTEGLAVLWLLRTAFVADKIFMVDLSTNSQMKVMWSGRISHKTSLSGGFGANGYPDPEYLARVKKELKICGIVSSYSSSSV